MLQGIRKSHSVRRADTLSASSSNRRFPLKQNLGAENFLEVWVQFLWIESFLYNLKTPSPSDESKTQSDTFTCIYKLKAKTQIMLYVIAGCT